MGRVADRGGIQFRVLNRRARAGRQRPARPEQIASFMLRRCRSAVRNIPDLTVIEAEADDLELSAGRVSGLKLADGRVVGAGTRGGDDRHLPAWAYPYRQPDNPGRSGGRGALDGVVQNARAAGICLGAAENRHRRGWIPPYHRLGAAVPAGDEPPEPFSALTARIENPQVQCGITRTNEATHQIIRDNVHRSPMYSGQIKSTGPRYCPSIEDKVVRFGERDGHQIFLEPEGLDDSTVYPNGISTSLPKRCSWPWWPPFRAWNAPAWCGPAMPSNMTMSTRAA